MTAMITTSILPIIGMGLLFVAIVLVVLGVGTLMDERRQMARRLTAPGEEYAEPMRQTERQNVLLEDSLLKRFEKFISPSDQEEHGRIRTRMIRAGYRNPSAVRIYYAGKFVLAAGLFALGLILVPLAVSTTPLPIVLVIALFMGLLGYVIPAYWVERQIQTRREQAELGFPDVLDMMLVCIEAGSGIDHAVRRVAREIDKINPTLADELRVVQAELFAGRTRATVFRDFAERLDVNDIKAFATVLKQSDEYGVSIAESMRVYAADMRNKRIMKAEEKANLMPVQVALGSIAFTVPPTMIIMAGPSFIMIMRVFGAMG